jgi:hypothetical protein
MLNYATDICNKEALKNQRRRFVSKVHGGKNSAQVVLGAPTRKTQHI